MYFTRLIFAHIHTQDITKKKKGGGGQNESGEEDRGHAVSIDFLFPPLFLHVHVHVAGLE